MRQTANAPYLAAAAAAIVLAAAPGGWARDVKRPQRPRTPPGKTDKPQVKPADIGELMKLYEAHKHVGLTAALPYRLLPPERYHRTRRFPMVVCLHGIPGQGDDNTLHLGATRPVEVLARPEMRERYPCFVFAPQAPTWWGDQPYGAKGGPRGSRAKHFPAMSLLLETVDELVTAYNLDPGRIYLTGHGMGAFGAFNALQTDPNLFAAAVAVSGGGDPNACWTYTHVPLWIFAGEKSPILHYSTDTVAGLKKFGGRPKLTVIEGIGTNCWQQVFEAQATWDWLFGQRRVLRLATTQATQPVTQPATQPTTQAATQPATAPSARRTPPRD